MQLNNFDKVGNKIKEYRELKGLTQAELGKKIDKSTITIRKYESNTITPPLEILNKLSATFNIDVSALINDQKVTTDFSIGNKIKKFRIAANLNRENLAQKLGVSVVTITRYENGTREPNIEIVRSIATALGVTPNDLYDIENKNSCNAVSDISKNIKNFRELLGISQRELARRINMSGQMISKIELGENSPSLETLDKIAVALGVNPKDLMDSNNKDITNNSLIISENIRRIRKSKNLTMKELGEKIGLSEQGIGNYERGDREPNFETLNRIAEALSVSINDLIGTNNSELREKTTESIPFDVIRKIEKYPELIEFIRKYNNKED